MWNPFSERVGQREHFNLPTDSPRYAVQNRTTRSEIAGRLNSRLR